MYTDIYICGVRSRCELKTIHERILKGGQDFTFPHLGYPVVLCRTTAWLRNRRCYPFWPKMISSLAHYRPILAIFVISPARESFVKLAKICEIAVMADAFTENVYLLKNWGQILVRTFVSIRKGIWDHFLASRALIIHRKAFSNLYVLSTTLREM